LPHNHRVRLQRQILSAVGVNDRKMYHLRLVGRSSHIRIRSGLLGTGQIHAEHTRQAQKGDEVPGKTICSESSFHNMMPVTNLLMQFFKLFLS
jgi:hypothetical protein